MVYLGGQRGYFQKLSLGSESLEMTSEGLGEMFEGDFSDMFAGKFPLMFLFSFVLLFKTPEGVVVGFHIFALVPK